MAENQISSNTSSPKIGDVFYHYTLIHLIRKTRHSFIFKAKDNDNSNNVAIKFIETSLSNDDNNEINSENFGRIPYNERVRNEIELMKEIDCPYIIKGLDYFDIDGFACVVMPFYQEGDLLNGEISMTRSISNLNLNDLSEISSGFPKSVSVSCIADLETANKNREYENMIKEIIYDALQALKYLHQHHIWHRDIKMENFLFYQDNGVFKSVLIDLGLAVKNETNDLLDEYVGTLHFAAPEIINNQPYDGTIDIWSLGVTMYYLLSKTYPFPLSPECALRRCISTGSFFYPAGKWKYFSKDSKKLIDRMLKVDPKKRITIDEALNDIWLSSLHK